MGSASFTISAAYVVTVPLLVDITAGIEVWVLGWGDHGVGGCQVMMTIGGVGGRGSQLGIESQ